MAESVQQDEVDPPTSGHFVMLYWASTRDFTGKASETLAAPLKVGQLADELEKRYPGIKAKILDNSLLTVNLDYVDKDDKDVVIVDGDEVSIIPPVSSG